MSDNPFETPPESTGAKMGFGDLQINVNRVELEKGASYTIPGLTNKDGELFPFKGKKLTPDGSNRHVILKIIKRKKDGELYTIFSHFMYWTKDVQCKISYPALQKVFGEKLTDGLTWKNNKSSIVPIQYEEVEFTEEGRTSPGRAFKVVKVFKSQAEREAAETQHFARFQSGEAGTNANTGAAFETGIPEGYTAESWKAMAEELLTKYQTHVQTLSGKPPEKRKAALKYIASEEAGSSPEQLAELIGV